jgi:hypothetical protein
MIKKDRTHMQRFKIGGMVLILPKFSHLYGSATGIVTAFYSDPYRSMFNEYVIECSDGSVANLLEFQLLEYDPSYQTLIGSVVFDSYQLPGATLAAGQRNDRLLRFTAPPIDIDMKIRPTGPTKASILGQISEGNHFCNDAEVSMLKESITMATTITDHFGVFKFDSIVRGMWNIHVLLKTNFQRILGAVSI